MIVKIGWWTADLKANTVLRSITTTKYAAYQKQYTFEKVSDYVWVTDIACYSALHLLEVIMEHGETRDIRQQAEDAITEWVLLREEE